jgi:hypothetical protein
MDGLGAQRVGKHLSRQVAARARAAGGEIHLAAALAHLLGQVGHAARG